MVRPVHQFVKYQLVKNIYRERTRVIDKNKNKSKLLDGPNTNISVHAKYDNEEKNSATTNQNANENVCILSPRQEQAV